MDLEVALYTQLKDHAGTAALVGTKIYPDYLPADKLPPAVVFELDDAEREHVMGGDSGDVSALYKMTCHGTSKANARAVATQVIAALRNFSGVMGGVGGVTVQWIYLEREYDDEVSGRAGDVQSKQKHLRAVEFLIWYKE